jgi:hypothetical protein
MNNFEDKEFKEVPGGKYDQHGFYHTPDGGFWDPDGVYFNKDGFDKHMGYYNENLEYTPGPGWIDELMCYEDEKAEALKIRKGPSRHKVGQDDDEEEGFDELDEIFDDRDIEKILREEDMMKYVHHQEPKVVATSDTASKEPVISPEHLFNKIPENKKPAEMKEQPVRKEKVVEVDSLFG